MDWIAILKVAGVGGGYVVAVIAVVVAWRYQTAAASRIREVETANRALDASGKAYATSLNAAEERRKADEAKLREAVTTSEAARIVESAAAKKKIDGYRAEIADLEVLLATSRDPAVARERCRRVLSEGPSSLRDLPADSGGASDPGTVPH